MNRKRKKYEVSLSQDRLKELLNYDPTTGVWIWKKVLTPCIKVGDVAGCKKKEGRVISVDGTWYISSNLVWLYMTGEWPQLLIDHKDGNNLNDQWSNLRLATGSQNIANSRKQKRSLLKGAHRHRNGFVSKIVVKRKVIYLGRFRTAEEAHKIYCIAAKKYFGEFARFS